MNWWVATVDKTSVLYWIYASDKHYALMILEHITLYKEDEICEIKIFDHPSYDMIKTAEEMGSGIYVWLSEDEDSEECDYVPVNERKLIIDGITKSLE